MFAKWTSIDLCLLIWFIKWFQPNLGKLPKYGPLNVTYIYVQCVHFTLFSLAWIQLFINCSNGLQAPLSIALKHFDSPGGDHLIHTLYVWDNSRFAKCLITIVPIGKCCLNASIVNMNIILTCCCNIIPNLNVCCKSPDIIFPQQISFENTHN